MADQNQEPDDELADHPDTEALMKVVDEVLAAEDDRAFEAREAARSPTSSRRATRS
jgi:hypothetical protein